MMNIPKLSNKTALVIDYGNFWFVAERLSRDFEKVYLYCPWEDSFPTYNKYVVGTGVSGVHRIYNIWSVYDEVDIFVFPDLFMGEFQDWLRSQGKLVFGAGSGEFMELYRDRMKEIQKSVGLPVNEYETKIGLDALREYLKENENKFIKTNFMRGNLESFHHQRYELTKPLLDEFEHSLGIYKNEELFIIESPIEAIAEIGYDGFTVNGKFPKKSMVGIEVKDCAYVGKFIDYDKLPAQIRTVNDKLVPFFDEHNYRGPYSNEIRVDAAKDGYLIDQTTRFGAPPGSITVEIYDNFSEIIWYCAFGAVPLIKNTYQYGVEIIIKSDWARSEPQSIYFPEKFKRWIKIKNMCIRDGVHYYIPQNIEMEEIGSVCGVGNTLEEAIKMATEISESIEGYCIKIDTHALDEAQGELNKLNKAGIKLF